MIMRAQREHVIDLLFSLSLLCVFTICGLLLVFTGISVYKDTVLEIERTYSERTALSYLAKQIRQNDTSGGVEITEIEGEVAILLTDEDEADGYSKYIYYNDGYICELYEDENTEVALSAGQPLLAVDGWGVVENENGTITLSIIDNEAGDEFNLTLSLRSE